MGISCFFQPGLNLAETGTNCSLPMKIRQGGIAVTIMKKTRIGKEISNPLNK
jgi:hypothetical protein